MLSHVLRYFNMPIILVLGFFLVACGGGGGGDGGDGLPRNGNLSTNTAQIAFEAEQNGLLPPDVIRSMTFNASVNQIAVGIAIDAPAAAWLSVFISGSSSPLQLNISANTTNLPPGNYSTLLRIVSGDASGNIIDVDDIPVEYTVHGPVSLSPATLSFNAVEGVAAGSQTITASSSTTPPSLSAFDNVAWLDQSASGSTVTVTPNANALSLPVGVHTAQVSVQYSIGRTVTSNIPVTYTISPALSGPSTIDINIDGATTLADLQGILFSVTSNRASSINWTASENQDWLILNTASGDTATSNNLSIDIDATVLESLANGAYQTSIAISSSDANVSDLIIPVNLNVNLPEVHYVAPYVAYTATVNSDYIIIRGEGLSVYDQGVLFSSTPPSSVSVISDTELRVTPPSLSVGTYVVEVDNALGFNRQTKDLVVKNAPAYSDATLAVNIGLQERILYDAERETVFTAQCYFCTVAGSNATASNVLKFSYNNTSSSWEYTAYPYTQLFDIAMTPDGQHLVVLTSTQLLLVNPATMVTEQTILLPFSIGGTANQLAVLNNGYILIRGISRAYSLVDQDFITLSSNMSSTIGIVTSADGSRAVYGYADNSGSLPYRYIDASTITEITTPAFYYFTKPAFDRHANRLFAGNNILDNNFNLVDTLADWSADGTISPDGMMAYTYDHSALQVRKFDLSGTPPFSELTPVDTADPGVLRMGISHDGSLLFIIGINQFIVMNAP